jgi:hypothetical protein
MLKQKTSPVQRWQQRTCSFSIIIICAFSLLTAIGCQSDRAELEARIQRIEAGLIAQPGIVIKGQPVPKVSLAQRMADYKVPGVSIAVMTNGDRGNLLFVEILRSIAAEYGWNDFLPAEKEVAEVSGDIYDSYVGTYEFTRAGKIIITREEDTLFADSIFVIPTGKIKCEIFPETETLFFMTKSYATITFLKDEDGKVTGLVLKEGNQKREARKIE